MFLMFKRRIAAGLIFAWFALLVGVTGSFALEPSTPLGRLGRQTWTMENGLPQNTVPVLLQSPDGFIWAGTELGLTRFDGIGFRTFDHATDAAFPDAEIRCLLDAGREGGLWIGTGDGLIRWKDGNATRFTTHEGLPGNAIRDLSQTSDGAVWVWTEGGLARWSGDRFQAASSENGLPGSDVTSIAADSSAGLWVGTTRGAFVFRQGHWQVMSNAASGIGMDPRSSERPALVKSIINGDVLLSSGDGIFREHDGAWTKILAKEALPADGITFLGRLSDGTVAAASKSSVVLAQGLNSSGRAIVRFTVSKELPGSRIESMYADREGCLWIGTSRGLARVTMNSGRMKEATVQLFPPSDPLASNAVISLLEDREGDLWAGTETSGLQILRDARFSVIRTSDGLNSDATTAVMQDAQRILWIGTRDNGLNRVLEGTDGQLTVSTMTTANGLPSNVILSLAASPNGETWIGTPDGLSRVGHDGMHSYSSADGLADDFIRSLLVMPDNSVWIGTRRGLTHMVQNRFQSLTKVDGLGSDLVGALARTADGDLWIATLNGLSQFHDGRLKNYTTADGLSSNVITALDVTQDGMVWIGTQDGGLNLWNGKRFVPVRADGADDAPSELLPRVIHGLTHDDQHLWLATDSGLTRLDLAALTGCEKQISSGACNLSVEHVINFTTADGLRSRETSSNSHPTVARAADGKLWFTTPRGVIVADPLHFPANPLPPQVAIERFAVDDREIHSNALTRITAGALRFRFDYAGLSFATPQKVRYEYMLEGFDHGWTDAGARRTAYYTNIAPGTYRFRVRAALGSFGAQSMPADRDGTAGSTQSYDLDEASMSFELLPRYYQTMWFRALMVLVVAVLVALVFRRRVLRVEREFRAVMAERNRIAREIHDTLAQGYVGISLQLEIMGELMRHNRADAAQKHLALTQEMVRAGLDDARQSIWALRSQDSGERTLPTRLRRVVEEAGGGDLTASLEVHGAYRALSAEAEQELLRIAQEAIHNVKRHAEATRLNVRLEYDDRILTLTVVDNGKGFMPDDARAAEGHYGLTGMRERSELIRGAIEIASVPGYGTTVSLSIPTAGAREKQPADDDYGKHSETSKEQQ